MRSLDQFRGDCSLKSWLCGIARNTWISGQRKKKPQPMEDAAELPDPAAGPEESIVSRDRGPGGIHRKPG